MEDEVDLERLRASLLLGVDAVAPAEAHPTQREAVVGGGHRAIGLQRTIASATRTVRAMCSTSWTRTTSAPLAIASATLAAVPSTRSLGGRPPRISPMKRLRDVPTSSGSPPR